MAEIRQKIVSCPNGHYYDANKYATCPHCSGGGFSATVAPGQGGASAASAQTPTPSQPAGNNFSPTLPPNMVQPAGARQGNRGSFSPTLPPNMVSAGAQQGNRGSFSPTLPPNAVQSGGAGQQGGGSFSVTLPPQSVKSGNDSSRFSETVFVDAVSKGAGGDVAPVVGWLVTLSGPTRGTDYRIHANYNYIGREVGDICIHGDKCISAQRDTSITFVSKTQGFYIAHEQGKNVLLVNDEPVAGGNRKLEAYDIITIGTTRLLFVPLCGSRFNWEDGVTPDE